MTFSPNYWGWLLLLVGCGQQDAAEQRSIAPPTPESAARHTASASLAQPAAAYTSGDREMTGPHDTLHVGQGLVLRLVPGSKRDFARAPRMTAYDVEAVYLKREDTAQVHRSKHTLCLTLADGSMLKLTNDTYDMRGDQNEEADKWYTFLGSLPQLPYWQVDSTAYEDHSTLLVNKLNGSVGRLWNYPIVSPDGKHIIVQSQGLETAMAPNGLQLFDVSTQKITLRWERLLQHWEPYRVHWLNNKTLAIEQLRFSSSTGEYEKLTYVRLLLP